MLPCFYPTPDVGQPDFGQIPRDRFVTWVMGELTMLRQLGQDSEDPPGWNPPLPSRIAAAYLDLKKT